MRYLIVVLLISLSPISLFAQEQQAGNAASANAEDTFKKLIEQCDDIDMLTKRAKVRVEYNRATPEAAQQAMDKMEEAFAKCGEGAIDEAKIMMDDAYQIARDGVTENFGVDASAPVQNAEPETAEDDDMFTYYVIGGVVIVLFILFFVFRRGQSESE